MFFLHVGIYLPNYTCLIPEDRNLNVQRHENHKFHLQTFRLHKYEESTLLQQRGYMPLPEGTWEGICEMYFTPCQ
jgi:hypothetical protein